MTKDNRNCKELLSDVNNAIRRIQENLSQILGARGAYHTKGND